MKIIAKHIVISCCLIVFGLMACATMQGANKSFSEMTTKEKAIYVMSMYNKQYDEYLSLYQKGSHTPEEKEILKTKYDLLKELNPYVGLYITYAEQNTIPTEEVEKRLIEIIKKLLEE